MTILANVKVQLSELEKEQYHEFVKLAKENEEFYKYSDVVAHDERAAVIQRRINELQMQIIKLKLNMKKV